MLSVAGQYHNLLYPNTKKYLKWLVLKQIVSDFGQESKQKYIKWQRIILSTTKSQIILYKSMSAVRTYKMPTLRGDGKLDVMKGLIDWVFILQ